MRCNCGVDPKALTDQHLVAEYRELLIPFGQIKNRLSPKLLDNIPSKMPLGKGHITFWRDKMGYLRRRHGLLVDEMKLRGFKPNLSFDYEIPSYLDNDWDCTEEAFGLLKLRIRERINEKPNWYRHYKATINDSYLVEFDNLKLMETA